MKYEKRLSCPSKENKYYYEDNVFYQSGYGIPNCTCYAWGRFYELSKERPKLCKKNAENWYAYEDGYDRGKTPKLGAVIVWSKGVIGKEADGAGHVAIVEEIYEDGSILTSNSAYSGTKFYTKKINKNYELNGYKFEGFIYNPIEFEPEEEPKKETPKTDTNKKSVEEIAKEVIAGKWGNGETRKQRLTEAGYSYSEVQAKVNELLGYNVPTQEKQYYYVQKGDNLTKIAKKFDTTVDKLVQMNKISNPNLIYVNQRIRVK